MKRETTYLSERQSKGTDSGADSGQQRSQAGWFSYDTTSLEKIVSSVTCIVATYTENKVS